MTLLKQPQLMLSLAFLQAQHYMIMVTPMLHRATELLF
jgi:hypothetical protein